MIYTFHFSVQDPYTFFLCICKLQLWKQTKIPLTAPDEVWVVLVGVLLAVVFVDPCCNTVLTTVWGACWYNWDIIKINFAKCFT